MGLHGPALAQPRSGLVPSNELSAMAGSPLVLTVAVAPPDGGSASSEPCIGLVGNMNNNNFALLRYFRDLGANAHLLLYADDGAGDLSHFAVECDTWDMARWAPFVHRTAVYNSLVSAIDAPLSWVVGGWSWLSAVLGRQRGHVKPVTAQHLRESFGRYERLLGTGIAPAALIRTDRALDVFYPYSAVIEFTESTDYVQRRRWLRRASARCRSYVVARQIDGIRRSTHVVTSDKSVCQQRALSFGVKPKCLFFPMVYNRELLPSRLPSERLSVVARHIARSDFSVMCHSRQLWSRSNVRDDLTMASKNSDWLIRAFRDFVDVRPGCRSLLVLSEYGPCVAASHSLISMLGLKKYVVWLPRLPRREIMWLLPQVSVCAGEFYSIDRWIWGGTGWEVLAAGKPLLQGFRFAEGEFEELYGHPPPPLLPVRSQADVLEGLIFAADHPERAAQMGQRAREWFNTHNGISLAKKWLALVTGA